MQQFTTRQNSFGELRKKLLTVTVFAHVIGVFIFLYFVNTYKEEADKSWVLTLMLMTLVLCFTTYKNMKRQKQRFETFCLTITEDAVVCEQLNTPTITLPKNTIREITRTPGGIFFVIGESKLNAIGIPAQIENPDELERALSKIKQVIIKSQWTPLVFLQLATLLFVMGGGSLGILSEDRIISTISGVAICGFLVYSFVFIHRSKNFDRRMKRMGYITIIPFLSILGYVVFQWLGD